MPSEKAKLNFCGKLLYKMGDFNIMTQKSILINFGMDFIIEIVNLDLLKNSESFIL